MKNYQVEELMKDEAKVMDLLREMERLQDELRAAKATIKSERENFSLLEKTVDEHEKASVIYNDYHKMRTKKSGE